MNNIKKILADGDKKFDKGINKILKEEHLPATASFLVVLAKEHIRQSQETLIEQVVKDLVGEEKAFDLRKDNPQYSLGQTNGWWLKTAEAEAKGKDILDQSNG